MTTGTSTRARPSRRIRRLFSTVGWWPLVELGVLCAFVVAQPVLDVLGRSPDFLVFRQAGVAQIVQLVAVLLVVPPVALWCVEVLVGSRSPSAARRVHAGFVGCLFAVFVVQVLERVSANGAVVVASAVAGGAAFGRAYSRWPPARLWLRAASPVPFAFALLFLFASPVSGLVMPPPSISHHRPVEHPSPVVLVVLDELPLVSMLDATGDIDARLYPNFAALAGDATFFRNATGVAARTPHAVPAMLSGRFPHRSLAPTVSQYPENLFALLAPSHQVRAFESLTALCPRAACPDGVTGPGRGLLVRDAAEIWFETVRPGRDRGKDLFGASLRKERSQGPRAPHHDDAWFLDGNVSDNQPRRFQEFLSSIDGTGTPFHFLHLILPHAPWQYLPDGLQYPPRDLGLVSYDQRTEEAWPALVNRQRHVLQAMYVDTLLGLTIDRLKLVDLYDRAAILVTADHGISFTPGLRKGTREMTAGNEHEVAWVPFFVKVPGQTEGTVSDANVMGVDVAPTVAELAGATLPWRADGISVVSEVRADPAKVWFNRPGKAHTVDAGAYDRVLSGGVERLLRAEEGPEGAFRIGPFADLVGVAVATQRVAEETGVVAVVHDAAAFEAVDERTGVVPSLVSGHLEGVPTQRTPLGLAISVNGTIATVSELFAHDSERHRFAGMVSPKRLGRGGNHLEAFLVERDDRGVVLRAVPIRPAGHGGDDS